MNTLFRFLNISGLLLTVGVFIGGCGSDSGKDDTAAQKVEIKSLRFEQDLFAKSVGDSGLSVTLKSKYGSFYQLFVGPLMEIRSNIPAKLEMRLRNYASDSSYQELYAEIQRKFADFSVYDAQLTAAFTTYHALFPDNTIPQVLTTISDFKYPIICDSSHLAISLEMYLDTGCVFYDAFQPPLPLYLRRRMVKEFLVSDAVRGWLESDYSVDESTSDLLQRMISSGRLWYVTKKLLPATHDSLISGYTLSQMEWCDKNESKIWSFMVNNKLLYSKDPNVLIKYVGPGPSTNGFPPESPGNIGQFIGYRIVEAYMKSHPDVTPSQLLEEKDLAKLFRESKYKPKR